MIKKFQESLNQLFCHFYYNVSLLNQIRQSGFSFERMNFNDPIDDPKSKVKRVKSNVEFGFSQSFFNILPPNDEKILDLCLKLKAKWFKTDLLMSFLNKKKNFEIFDEIVKKFNRKRIKILATLGTFNDGRIGPPSNKKEFFNYVEESITRYSGKIEHYEIWNEPNVITMWNSSFHKFSNLLKEIASFIKELDSKIKIAVNVSWMKGLGIPWSLGFLKKLSERGALKNIDFITLHAYPSSWEPGNFYDWKKKIELTRKLLDNLGEDKPIWVTEFGFFAFRNPIFYPHVPKIQTQYLVKAFETIAKTEEVPVALWFCLQDTLSFPNRWFQAYLPQERTFGLFTKTFKPKDPNIIKIVRKLIK